jgi:hypothetical protein
MSYDIKNIYSWRGLNPQSLHYKYSALTDYATGARLRTLYFQFKIICCMYELSTFYKLNVFSFYKLLLALNYIFLVFKSVLFN